MNLANGRRRITITWPAAPYIGAPLNSSGIQIVDFDSGMPILTATGLRIEIGGDFFEGRQIEADLTLCVDEHGNPVDRDGPFIKNSNGTLRTGVFRFHVVGMSTSKAP